MKAISIFTGEVGSLEREGGLSLKDIALRYILTDTKKNGFHTKDNRFPQKVQFTATLQHGVPELGQELQSPGDYHSLFMPR